MLRYKFDPRTLIFICLLTSSMILGGKDIKTQLYIFTALLLFTGLLRGFYNSFLKVIYKMRHLLVTIFILQLLFRHGGEVYFQYHFIQISEAGLLYAFSSLIRYSVIILGSIMLSAVSLNEYLDVFHYYHLPKDLSLTVTFCIQYLSSFSKQIKSISQVIRQRNLYSDQNIFRKIHILKEVSLPLLIKSLSEVQYKALALELKGISLNPVYQTNLKFKRPDYYIIGVWILFILCVICL